MPTTLAQARTAIRERLDEPSARQWTDKMLTRWIFEGCKDVARKTETLQHTVDIDCAASTQKYALPTDLIRVYRATWKNDNDDLSSALEYRDFNNADAVWWTSQAITEGTPFMFTMWGILGSAEIVLYPTPAMNGTLTIQYYRLPATPTVETDALDIPEGWEDLVYSWVEMRALKQDRDPRWQEAKAEYDEQVGAMYDLTRRYTDQQGQTIQGEFPRVNGWLYEFD